MRYELLTHEGTRYVLYDSKEKGILLADFATREDMQAWMAVKHLIEDLRRLNPNDPDIDLAEAVLLEELEGE